MTLKDSFVDNLDYLCGFYPSVADVCRRLGISRQQFNKYLAGQFRPSRHNLHRICDFFGVSESEIFLEHDQFVAIVSSLGRAAATNTPTPLARVTQMLCDNSQDLDRYAGYYYRYFYSFGYPGHITRSLASLYASGGRYYWKNVERRHRSVNGLSMSTSKYSGIVFYLNDRIFITEYESTLKGSISQVILYPSYSSRIVFLRGIQTGAPTMHGRKPGASVVVLEYLGRNPSLYAAMRRIGLFRENDPAIDGTIRELVRNRIDPDSYVFEIDGVV